MHLEWRNFLLSQYANLHENTELSEKLTGNYMVPLCDFSVIKINGVDTTRFLQGQLTCDVTKLNASTAILSACCDHKGRIQANFWIWRAGEDYFLLLPTQMSAIILEHFRKYVVFSKVKLAVDESLVVLGIGGPEILNAVATFTKNNIQLLKIPHENQRYLVMGEVSNMIQLWQHLKFTATPISKTDWTLLNIRQEITFIYPQTKGEFIPQMINLQLFEGVSFTKGCYVGQEIVARTQHLGILKRHLFQAELQGPSPSALEPGELIYDQQNQEIGVVTEAAIRPNGTYEFLAVIRDQMLTKTTTLQLSSGLKISII